MDAKVNIDLGSGVNLANIGQLHSLSDEAGDFAVANDDFITFSANSSPKARKQGQFSPAPRAMLFPNPFFQRGDIMKAISALFLSAALALPTMAAAEVSEDRVL